MFLNEKSPAIDFQSVTTQLWPQDTEQRERSKKNATQKLKKILL
jgi:hypothetical protein